MKFGHSSSWAALSKGNMAGGGESGQWTSAWGLGEVGDWGVMAMGCVELESLECWLNRTCKPACNFGQWHFGDLESWNLGCWGIEYQHSKQGKGRRHTWLTWRPGLKNWKQRMRSLKRGFPRCKMRTKCSDKYVNLLPSLFIYLSSPLVIDFIYLFLSIWSDLDCFTLFWYMAFIFCQVPHACIIFILNLT